jgi:hypothetical protein
MTWLKENTGNVKLRSSTYHGPGENPTKAFITGQLYTLNPGLAMLAGQLPDPGRARLFAVFEVLKPVFWPSAKFGFPSIVESVAAAQQQDDVHEKEKNIADVIPNPEDFLASAGAALKSTGKVALVIGGIAAVVGIAYLAIVKKLSPL